MTDSASVPVRGKSNKSKVVQSGMTDSVVEDDEGPAWCDRVCKEVVWYAIDAVVGRDRRKVGVGSLQI
jgi:hypothetical protein